MAGGAGHVLLPGEEGVEEEEAPELHPLLREGVVRGVGDGPEGRETQLLPEGLVAGVGSWAGGRVGVVAAPGEDDQEGGQDPRAGGP